MLQRYLPKFVPIGHLGIHEPQMLRRYLPKYVPIGYLGIPLRGRLDIFYGQPSQAVEETVKLQMVWDSLELMWHDRNAGNISPEMLQTLSPCSCAITLLPAWGYDPLGSPDRRGS